MAAPGPAPINRLPRGLLDFLDIKSMGVNPQVLVPTLQPTLEMFRFYGDVNATEVFHQPAALVATGGSNAFNVTSTGPVDLTNGVTLQVPQTELWVLLEANISWAFIGLGAGGRGEFGLDVLGLVAGISWRLPMTLNGNVESIAGNDLGGQRTLDRPFFCMPGSQILWRTFGHVVPAGAINLVLRLRVVRLRV